MNVYDFDKTVFYPDSSASFILFSLRRHPSAFIRTAPAAALYWLLYILRAVKTKKLKEKLFAFLRYIPDAEGDVELFWKENFDRIGLWYLAQKRSDDVIISASPEFLLRPAAEKLGVRLIGTRMDINTGRINGENCHDVEKPLRFAELFPGGRVEAFYSDSLSDAPMAKLAERAYLVKKEKISNWG